MGRVGHAHPGYYSKRVSPLCDKNMADAGDEATPEDVLALQQEVLEREEELQSLMAESEALEKLIAAQERLAAAHNIQLDGQSSGGGGSAAEGKEWGDASAPAAGEDEEEDDEEEDEVGGDGVSSEDVLALLAEMQAVRERTRQIEEESARLDALRQSLLSEAGALDSAAASFFDASDLGGRFFPP